jgi:hypothetical protein
MLLLKGTPDVLAGIGASRCLACGCAPGKGSLVTKPGREQAVAVRVVIWRHAMTKRSLFKRSLRQILKYISNI